MPAKYRIMIVDDEEEVRLGILKRIRWEELGFTVVADAENGQDALEKADGTEIDVVMTDIKMPYMDGLKFASALLKMQPSVKLIILSGFNEFEYAKEAIKLNVVEYVLKPVNSEELSEVLKRVKQTLDNEVADRRNVSRLNDYYEKSLPLLRENFFERLLSGAIDEAEIAAGCAEYKIKLDNNPYKVITTFLPGANGYIEQKLIPFSLCDIISERLTGRCSFEVLMRFPAVVVISAYETKNNNLPINAANEICSEVKRTLGCDITAGVSRFYRELSATAAAFAESNVAIEYRALAGGSVVSVRDIELSERVRPASSSEAGGALLHAIRFASPEVIESAVRSALAELPSEDSIDFLEKELETVAAVLRLARQYPEAHGILADVADRSLTDRERFADWLMATCIRLNSSISETRVTGTARVVETARKHIEDHFADSSISVETMCDALHISASYFSTLFKQETGKSFIQYLTDVRLERALELLKTTDDKTYIIAEKSGYDEPNYFSYVFKKKYGVSPSQFRKG